MDITYEALVKLGEAIYIHKHNIDKAEKAEEAIEYLKSERILTK